MTAYSSFGTLLQMSDTDGGGGAGVFTTIAQVLDISGPAFSVDTEETTNQSSAGGYEEIIPTIKRSGNLECEILFDPSAATHDQTTGVIFVMNGRKLRSYRLVMPTSPSRRWNFDAYIVGFDQENPVAGTQRASLTLKITGQPTLSA